MARGRHGRPCLPLVSYGIEGLDFAACSAAIFAAEDKNFAGKSRSGNAASDAGNRRAGSPTIGCRIVFFMITDAAVMVAVDATGYRMEFFIDNTDGMMVSRSWHRRVLCPAILNRIIRFVGMSVSSVGADASCGKDFSCDHADGKGAAGASASAFLPSSDRRRGRTGIPCQLIRHLKCSHR